MSLFFKAVECLVVLILVHDGQIYSVQHVWYVSFHHDSVQTRTVLSENNPLLSNPLLSKRIIYIKAWGVSTAAADIEKFLNVFYLV